MNVRQLSDSESNLEWQQCSDSCDAASPTNPGLIRAAPTIVTGPH
jgi:hypothetical protein